MSTLIRCSGCNLLARAPRPPAALAPFGQAIGALRNELDERLTIEGFLAAATRLRKSTDPAAIMTGIIIGIALEQGLIAEVAAGRLAPGTRCLLAGDLHMF